jgi:hypothetical protein
MMLARLLGLGRVGLGLVAVASPRGAARLFALPAAEVNPSSSLVSRLLGNRELVLGATLALASDGQLPLLLKTSAVIDAGDALLSLWTLRDGIGKRAAYQSATAGAFYAALELIALRRA